MAIGAAVVVMAIKTLIVIVTIVAIVTVVAVKAVINLSGNEPGIKCKELVPRWIP